MIRYWILTLVLLANPAYADLTLSGRYDNFFTKKQNEVSKILLTAELNYQTEFFRVYADSFFDVNFNSDSELKDKGYLQEAYVDYLNDRFLIRAGKQSLRWSEMWTLPSLDYWTARRWNRVFYDAFKYQMNHPLGVLLSYGGEFFGAELFYSHRTPNHTYPENLPVPQDEYSENDYGIRTKFNFDKLQINVLAAQIDEDLKSGISGNLAFEHIVLKAEYGHIDRKENKISLTSEEFAILGADIFVGDFVITPQVSYLKKGEFLPQEDQMTYYLSSLLKKDNYEWFVQGYYNPETEDMFLSTYYTKFWKNSLGTSLFLQRYESSVNGVYYYFPVPKDEYIVGFSFDFSKVFEF